MTGKPAIAMRHLQQLERASRVRAASDASAASDTFGSYPGLIDDSGADVLGGGFGSIVEAVNAALAGGMSRAKGRFLHG